MSWKQNSRHGQVMSTIQWLKERIFTIMMVLSHTLNKERIFFLIVRRLPQSHIMEVQHIIKTYYVYFVICLSSH